MMSAQWAGDGGGAGPSWAVILAAGDLRYAIHIIGISITWDLAMKWKTGLLAALILAIPSMRADAQTSAPPPLPEVTVTAGLYEADLEAILSLERSSIDADMMRQFQLGDRPIASPP